MYRIGNPENNRERKLYIKNIFKDRRNCVSYAKIKSYYKRESSDIFLAFHYLILCSILCCIQLKTKY